MTKETLINDMKFKITCLDFATDFLNGDFEVYGDVIKLNSKESGIYTLIDKYYNVIGIYKDELSLEHQTKEELANKIAEIYKKYSEVDETGKHTLPTPFETFSLQQILELSKRINIIPSNHGHSADMIVNGQIIDKINEDDYSAIYFYFLTYIDFLGKCIKQYYKEAFHIKSLGFDYPDVYEYLNSLVANLEKGIHNLDDFSARTLGKSIGKTGDEFMDNYSLSLYQIIKFYVLHYKKIENKELDKNLFLKILDVPSELVEERYSQMNKFIYPDSVNLLDLIQPETGYSLNKKNKK